MRQYLGVAQIVTPANVARVAFADPDDDQVLACALVAKADLVVSGDRHLLQLKRYEDIPIVNTVDALRLSKQA